MTYLFEDNYKDALDTFTRFMEKSADGNLYEDASFRKAVCLYGLENYTSAAENLEGFLKEFPTDALTPEAHTLLGDCYGAIGELEKALEHYKQVEDCAVKQSQIDYAALQVGRIYEQFEQFKEMEDWLTRYLDKLRTERRLHSGDLPQRLRATGAGSVEGSHRYLLAGDREIRQRSQSDGHRYHH